jgi:hypothetical protein
MRVTGAKSGCLLLAFSFSLISGCQSTDTSTAALDSATTNTGPQSTEQADLADPTQSGETEALLATSSPTDQTVLAAAPQILSQCAIQLASGPPPVPPRGADFGEAVAKNTGKTIKRGVIQQIGGAVAGGLGAVVAGSVAQTTIRNEEDIKGVWKITDGSQNCACEVSVDSIWKLQGKGEDKGQSQTKGCSDPTVTRIAGWHLGYAFAGYGAKFDLLANDKKTVLASMTREGIHYFTGKLSDGRPVTMWREGQNIKDLSAYKKSVK